MYYHKSFATPTDYGRWLDDMQRKQSNFQVVSTTSLNNLIVVTYYI